MFLISWNPSFSHLLHSIPVLIPDSDNPFPVTGTGIQNCIPKFWEREREWKIAFPTFGNGNGNEKIIPNFREREWEAGIPRNGWEREFPLTPVRGVLIFHLKCYDLIQSTHYYEMSQVHVTKKWKMSLKARLICWQLSFGVTQSVVPTQGFVAMG